MEKTTRYGETTVGRGEVASDSMKNGGVRTEIGMKGSDGSTMRRWKGGRKQRPTRWGGRWQNVKLRQDEGGGNDDGECVRTIRVRMKSKKERGSPTLF